MKRKSVILDKFEINNTPSGTVLLTPGTDITITDGTRTISGVLETLTDKMSRLDTQLLELNQRFGLTSNNLENITIKPLEIQVSDLASETLTLDMKLRNLQNNLDSLKKYL